MRKKQNEGARATFREICINNDAELYHFQHLFSHIRMYVNERRNGIIFFCQTTNYNKFVFFFLQISELIVHILIRDISEKWKWTNQLGLCAWNNGNFWLLKLLKHKNFTKFLELKNKKKIWVEKLEKKLIINFFLSLLHN